MYLNFPIDFIKNIKRCLIELSDNIKTPTDLQVSMFIIFILAWLNLVLTGLSQVCVNFIFDRFLKTN